MAAGDIKGDEAVVIPLIAGAAVTKGMLVRQESDKKYDPATDADTGKFAVAVEDASGDTVSFRAVIYGPVEVKVYGTAKAGNVMMAAPVDAATLGRVIVSDHGAIGENCGTMMEDADTSGNTYTMWVGLVE